MAENNNDLTLAIIAKNEEKGLEKAILSAKPFVDKIVISVDTKSTDLTLDIAKKLADEVHTHIWESSFAKARNDLQKHVKTKWVLWLDAHEYIEKCENLKEALELDVEGLLVKIKMEDGFRFHFARIIRSHVNWVRPVHNLPECKTSKIYKDFLIVHDRVRLQEAEAAKERYDQRNEMNFKGLQDEIKKDKKNTRPIFYLAQQYLSNKEYKKAIKYYKQYLKRSKTEQERWIACWEIAKCASLINKHKLAIKFLKKAEKELPKRWEVAKRIGATYMYLNKWKDALPYLIDGFNINVGNFVFEPEERNNAITWFMVGQCFFNLREYEKGKVAFKRALDVHASSDTEKLTADLFRTVELTLRGAEMLDKKNTMIEVCFLVGKRYQRVPEILNQLKAQTIQNFRVNIWNNSGQDLDISAFPKDRIQVINSKENVGSQARFKLVKETTGNPIIFFDDDESLAPDFISYHYGEYLKFGPKYILGWFNRKFPNEDYWKAFLLAPYGEEVDYVGTGGMVLDREIIDVEESLQNIPPEYARAEDLYLSYLARMKYNIKLVSIDKKCEILPDIDDQYRFLGDYKQKAFLLLRKKGWRLLKDCANKNNSCPT